LAVQPVVTRIASRSFGIPPIERLGVPAIEAGTLTFIKNYFFLPLA
jgi:hypothetical protein